MLFDINTYCVQSGCHIRIFLRKIFERLLRKPLNYRGMRL